MTTDKTVLSVIEKFNKRSKKGMETYGTTLHDNKKDLKFWLLNSIEEKMDDILYMQRALEEIEKTEIK